MSSQTEDLSGPLPRGRHRLTRDQVQSSQYRRLCGAALVAVGELGYATTTVADIVSRAQVARRTFYAMFASKDECFAAAYDFGVALGMRRLREVMAVSGSLNFDDRVRTLFEIYLATLAAQPAATRALYVETLVAGAPLQPHRARVRRLFGDYFMDVAQLGYGAGELRAEPDRELVDMLLGGIDDRIRASLHEQGVAALPELAPLFTRTAMALCDTGR